jgi:SAM-dependent methyltransferase
MLDLARRIVYRQWPAVHGVRSIELARLLPFLGARAGESVLDLGSGKGALCGRLSRGGVRMVGADPALASLAIAKRWVDGRGAFVEAAGEGLPFADGTFDRAISVCVLEHTRDDRRVLSEVRRVLKPGGTFALSVDTLDSPHVTEADRRHHVAEYRCNQLYDASRIRTLLAGEGFEVLETRYLFCGRLAAAVLRWGTRYHYRGPFLLLFPLVLPLLWLDEALSGGGQSGMILTVRCRKG